MHLKTEELRDIGPNGSALLTIPEACEYLRVPRSTLYTLVLRHGVRRIKIGRSTRYLWADIWRLASGGAR